MYNLLEQIVEKYKGIKTPLEIADMLDNVINEQWTVGFNDRGMGRGDFAVVTKNEGFVIVKCPSQIVATHISQIHNNSLLEKKCTPND